MTPTIRYILSVLLYGQDSAIDQVNYATQADPDSPYLVTILGQGIDGELYYPDLGQPKVEKLKNGHYIIQTDIVYNTFFFISRAEEVLNSKRDQHGRFLAQYSHYDTNEWSIPLVDEYSLLLLNLLNLPLPTPGFNAIYLTHDIDSIAYYRHLRGIGGGIGRGHISQVLASIKDIHQDPAYTFPWLIEQDAQVKDAQVIYFIKHTSGRGLDYPQYCLHGNDYRTTSDMLLKSGAQLGIHSSAYATYPLPKGQLHRSHYLSCSIDRMQQLVEAGYTDDYTMGFADLAGFRLRTTRAVRWINPLTRQLTPLTLHPLTVMDCTLSNENYMHLTEDDAYHHVEKLIDMVKHFHGEFTILWHNNTPSCNPYHFTLYPKLLQLL